MSPSRAQPRVSAVVPAYNEQGYIGACLESLVRQTDRLGSPLPRELYEVVVVDNGSTDDTPGEVERLARRYPTVEIHLIQETRKGVAHARKAGMDWAATRHESDEHILASTDADTIVHPCWIAGILDVFASSPGIAYAAGGFRFRDEFAVQLDALGRSATTWNKLTTLLAPMKYIETVGCNFALVAEAYREIGGMPLLSVGEDLAVSELLIAGGRVGAWLPYANTTSERRAACDPFDFLTASNRMQAWGSHGQRQFQPYRECRITDGVFDGIRGNESEVIRACLDYYVLQHIVKPLVIVERFRQPILEGVLGLDASAFSSTVRGALERYGRRHPFYLEDVILHVDRAHHAALLGRLVERLDAVPHDAAANTDGIPFYCRADG